MNVPSHDNTTATGNTTLVNQQLLEVTEKIEANVCHPYVSFAVAFLVFQA